MSSLTVRLPDSKHERLKEVARARGLRVNKFIEELTTIAIAQQDALTRFTLRASRGDADKGLKALDKLDGAFKLKCDLIYYVFNSCLINKYEVYSRSIL